MHQNLLFLVVEISFITAFCVKLTYIAILRYRRAVDEVAVEICTFVLQIFFVRGMQVIKFYNIVYVYVHVR